MMMFNFIKPMVLENKLYPGQNCSIMTHKSTDESGEIMPFLTPGAQS